MSTKTFKLFGKKKQDKNDSGSSPDYEEADMSISLPTNVKHEWHVGFECGKFVGLPPAWEVWLDGSNIR